MRKKPFRKCSSLVGFYSWIVVKEDATLSCGSRAPMRNCQRPRVAPDKECLKTAVAPPNEETKKRKLNRRVVPGMEFAIESA